MKKYILSFLIVSAFFIAPISVSAHPGNTASDGCHYCRTNCEKWGEQYDVRHCHNGGSSLEKKSAPQPAPKPVVPECTLHTAGTCNGTTYNQCDQQQYDECAREEKFWIEHRQGIRDSIHELLQRDANDEDVTFYENYSKDLSKIRELIMQSDEYKKLYEENKVENEEEILVDVNKNKEEEQPAEDNQQKVLTQEQSKELKKPSLWKRIMRLLIGFKLY
jgi:hypothetical protein